MNEDKNPYISDILVVVEKISGKSVTPETRLIGTKANIDSMQLVEICLALEDLSDEVGFEFDWSSENAMSQSSSMFRDVESLANEFFDQSKKQ